MGRTSYRSPALRGRTALLAAAACAALALGPASVQAQDAMDDAPHDHTAAPLDRDEALHLVEAGKRAMGDSDGSPARTVDAALAFANALRFFTAAGDSDMVCELNADLFWCKKRMNLEEMRSYVAAKGGGADERKLIAEASAALGKQVQADEVQGYFDRAGAYARAHPEDYAQITSRYLEVAERFPGSPLGAQAQVLSLAAEKQLLERNRAQQEALHATIFTRPAPAPAPDRAALPPPEAVRAAVAELKKQRKDEYAQRRPGQKRRLAARLAKDAEDAAQPPALRYAMLAEAEAVAVDAKEYYALLTTADAVAASFAVGAKEQKLAWLARERGSAVPAAMAKLLDDPLDGEANATVGRELCFVERHWDEGLPVLAHGDDAALKAVAEMELFKPEGTLQQVELADRWYELGVKASGVAKEQMIGRSAGWYARALPGLKGMTKERIARRVDELAELLPYTLYNYANDLTLKQWERIPGKAIALSAASQRQDTGLVLTPGMRVRIVPNPLETWNFAYPRYRWMDRRTKEAIGNVFDTNCWGWDPKAKTARSITADNAYPAAIGAVVMCIDNGPKNLIGLLKGDEHAGMVKYVDGKTEGSLSGLGRVFIGANLPGKGKGSGQIRVKICVLDDE